MGIMDGEKKELIKEMDLLKITRQLLERWKFILTVMLCFAIFGIVIAFSTVKTYTSDVVVAPEASSSSFTSNFAPIASMVGMDIGLENNGEALYPMLYPDIASSLPFLTSLLDANVKTIDENVDTTYFTYKRKYQKRTWLDDAKAIPSKLIKFTKSLFSSAEPARNNSSLDPYRLSESEMLMVESLQSVFNVFVDKKTNVVTITFSDRDPRVAASMADTITNRLQKAVTEYRTKKAIDYCKYVEMMYIEAKDSLEAAQKRYADFVDRNRNVTNEHVLIEKERFTADKELKASLNAHWAQQLQLAKARVQESTPVFVTLKPAAIPAFPSSMGRMTMIMIYALLGSAVAIVYILISEYYKHSRKENSETVRE